MLDRSRSRNVVLPPIPAAFSFIHPFFFFQFLNLRSGNSKNQGILASLQSLSLSKYLASSPSEAERNAKEIRCELITVCCTNEVMFIEVLLPRFNPFAFVHPTEGSHFYPCIFQLAGRSLCGISRASCKFVFFFIRPFYVILLDFVKNSFILFITQLVLWIRFFFFFFFFMALHSHWYLGCLFST